MAWFSMPFTDNHQLNLDFILSKYKKLEDDEAEIRASLEGAEAAAEGAAESATEAAGSASSAQDSAAAAESTASDIEASRNQIAVNTSRIDNLIASAGDGTIPSELVDIRTGYNGVTYPTAGDAVREQASRLTQFPLLLNESSYTGAVSPTAFLMSDRIIPANTWIHGVRLKANSASTGYVYVIDQVSKVVKQVTKYPVTGGWNTIPLEYKTTANSLIGYYNIPMSSSSAPTAGNTYFNYYYSTGYYDVSTPKPAAIGDTLTFTNYSAEIQIALPLQWIVEYNAGCANTWNQLYENDKKLKTGVYDLLGYLQPTNRTSGGLTYNWTNNQCDVSGLITASSTSYIYQDQNILPKEVNPGDDIYIQYWSDKLVLTVGCYVPGNVVLTQTREPVYVHIPDNAQGMYMYLGTSPGVFADDTVNETVKVSFYKPVYGPDLNKRIYTNQAYMSIIDDDSGASAHTFWDSILANTGIRIGLACIAGYMSGELTPTNPAYTQMSLDDLKDFYDNGNEVYSHSWSHPAFYDSSLDAIAEECYKSKQWLDNNGFSRCSDTMVYPGGIGLSDMRRRNVVRGFYKYGITSTTETSGVNTFPYFDNLNINRINGDTATLAELQAAIDQAAAERGHLVIMTHAYQMMQDATNNQSKMTSAIQYAQNNNVLVLPFNEASNRAIGK